MRSDEPRQTVSDYLVLVFSPVLVMGLVGSLVYFLAEVCYAGRYEGRLLWTLFFFVFGAVLVARLSMTGETSGKEWLYGPVLAGCTWLALQKYVEYPKDSFASELSGLINLFLVCVVWWCAHRITWDCTQIDDQTDVTGQGVLQAAGIDAPPPEPKPQPEAPATKGTWLQRYQRYREERGRKRTLGVWVIWFSLAALPIFGLGQSLIPAEDPARRRYTFWLMTVYVGCGLGLLLTTCFLGLRRYLRQKKLQMPAAMTGVWLTVGGGLIVVLLVVGAFLPRPRAEYPLIDLARAGSQKREASRWALKGDGQGKGEGRPGSEGQADPKGAPGNARTKSQGGEGDKQKGDDAQGQGDKGSGQSNQSDSKGDGDSGKGQSGNGKSPDSGKDSGQKGQQQDQAGKEGRRGEQGDKGEEKGGSKDGSQTGGSSSSAVRSLARGVSGVLKWVVFAAIALAVLLFGLRGLLKFLANFTDWAQGLLDALRNFWASLFASRKQEATEAAAGTSAEPQEYHPPFSAFPNPFADGSAGRMSAAELVRYTFAAVQAWARERGMARHPGETPLEFVGRVAGDLPTLEDALRRLVMLYGRAAYARGPLPAGSDDAMRQFWDRLEQVSEQPLSA
jgi:hypothetical protein